MSDNASIDDQIEFLWNIIGRIDSYISATNYKAALLLAYNAAALKFIYGDVGVPMWSFEFWALVMTVISMTLVFWSVMPNLGGLVSAANSRADSVIYFAEISKLKREEYSNRYRALNKNEILHDLSCQVHEVSSIANKKFNIQQVAIVAIFVQLLLFIAAIVRGL